MPPTESINSEESEESEDADFVDDEKSFLDSELPQGNALRKRTVRIDCYNADNDPLLNVIRN